MYHTKLTMLVGNCEDCADGKKVIVYIDLGKSVFLHRMEIY